MTVEIPGVFWHPSIQIPRGNFYFDDVTAVETRFLESLGELRLQEETGQVSETVIVNTILAAWQLTRMWDPKRRDEVKNMLEVRVPEIARKYGFTKLWRAHYQFTLQRRVSELLKEGIETIEARRRCARCGRAIWNKLSVRRGLGPICKDKVGVPV
jgi:hypothetical protein